MSLLGMLFGCKAAPLKGPDFEAPIPKVLHIQPYLSVTYDMPGNMSNLMGFSTKYANESPRTKTLDLEKEQNYAKFDWREALDVDGAMWDYNIKNQASINLRIEIMKKDKSTTLVDFIKDAYETFYNGTNGLNTELRQARPNHTDEDFGDKLRIVPDRFSSIEVNKTHAISWQEIDKMGGYEVIFYAFEIDAGHTLLFAFKHTISIDKESDIPLIKNKIQVDIQEYMKHVDVKKI